jgi:hypothetical protein
LQIFFHPEGKVADGEAAKDTEDHSHRPHILHTMLFAAPTLVIRELRRLPVVTRHFINPDVSPQPFAETRRIGLTPHQSLQTLTDCLLVDNYHIPQQTPG